MVLERLVVFIYLLVRGALFGFGVCLFLVVSFVWIVGFDLVCLLFDCFGCTALFA